MELLAQGQGIGEIAVAVGVHRATLWKWSQRPAFVQACDELRREARRATADKMRENAVQAAAVIGTVLEDGEAALRDRLFAARLALEFARSEDHAPDAGPPLSWEAIVQGTAKRAADLLLDDGALAISDARTPGQAWALAGLPRESFEEVERLRRDPLRAQAYCDQVLAELERELDARAFDGTSESQTG